MVITYNTFKDIRSRLPPSLEVEDEFGDVLSKCRHGLAPNCTGISRRNSFSLNGSYIFIAPEIEDGQLGTAGFDLRVGNLIAESDTIAERVHEEDLLKMPHKRLQEGEEYVLQHDKDGGKIYYVTSLETIILSPDLEMLIDSKSTTGRVGAMSHGVGRTEGGELITIIQPFAFPLKVTCGKTKLSQAVVRYKNTPYMSNEEIKSSNEIKFYGDHISLEHSLTPKGLLMKFNTEKVYRARECAQPIDMDARETLNWREYFELIEGNSQIILDKKTLYLLGNLGTIELGAACGLLSREQEVLTGTGAWSHFAGIFQPFFRGGITMEFYSYSKRKVKRGDRCGIVVFDEISGIKERPKDYGGSYQNQIPPLLPKMFKQD